MLNQWKEVSCICVSFQESRDSIKEKPEMDVYYMLHHIGVHLKAA